MEATRQRKASVERHAGNLARRSLRDAGPVGRVAGRIGRNPSTVSHYTTDRPCPTLDAAFRLLLTLPGDGTTGRAFVDAAAQAIELREIVMADTDTLVARGLYLLDREADTNAKADIASITGVGFSAAHEAQGAVSYELAGIYDELEFRGTDLLAEYRNRRTA